MTIPRWVYALAALLALWIVLGNVWLSNEKAETKKLEVPPITESDLREIDRQMLGEGDIVITIEEGKVAG